MTAKDWYSDPNNAIVLKTVLDSPVMRRALAFLEAAALPVPAPLGSDPVQIALAHQKLAGYAECLRDLKRLTELPQTGDPSSSTATTDDLPVDPSTDWAWSAQRLIEEEDA